MTTATGSGDWFWRFRMDLPPRREDRETLKRIAPELFEGGHDLPDRPRQGFWDGREFRDEIRRWLATEEARSFVTVREGTCPQPGCPLRLGGRPGPVLSGLSEGEVKSSDGNPVIELMTVAGGWTVKAPPFFDAARKVHGGKGPVKDLLITDPYIYNDKSEDGTTGGLTRFLEYLDVLDIPGAATLTIFQPPFAKGRKIESGRVWRKVVGEHAQSRGYKVAFDHFRTVSETRFHDRFYLARHQNGAVSGLFGPSMNGLNDKSFVLVGELEAMTMKQLRGYIHGWT